MTNNYRPPSPFDLSSPYGYRNDPKTKEPHKFHSGQDYRAPSGTPVPTAASGAVVYSGFNDRLGNVVIIKNDTGDYSLYGHLQDGDQAKLGQRVWPGDAIGRVGNTGERTTGPHLHYSIIRGDARGGVENPQLLHDGGPTGVALNERTTIDPAQYDDYNPAPRYLSESRRAAEIMSSGIATSTSDWPDVGSGAGSPSLAPIAPTANAALKPSVANAQATSQPLPGIFSGKPMPDWPVPPPIFQPKDQSSPDDDELYQRWRQWLDA